MEGGAVFEAACMVGEVIPGFYGGFTWLVAGFLEALMRFFGRRGRFGSVCGFFSSPEEALFFHAAVTLSLKKKSTRIFACARGVR